MIIRIGMFTAALGEVSWRAAKRFYEQNTWAMGSHIALSMMFALFPFIVFALAAARAVNPEIQSEDLVYLIFGSWPEVIAQPIEKEVQAVLDQTGKGSMTFGALLTIFFASNGVDAVRVGITEEYRDDDPRPFWKTRGLCILFVLLGAVLLVIAALMFIVLPIYTKFASDRLPDFAEYLVQGDLWRSIIMMSLLLFTVYACHAWLPGVRHSDRTILPGVFLTIILWVISARLLAYYLGSIATYSITYAGLAGVMSALIFLYLMSAILLYGAVFNDELARWRRRQV